MAMRTHPMRRQLQEHACYCLRRLCHNNDSNKKRIVSTGGLDSLMSAMHHHRVTDTPLLLSLHVVHLL
jgi:hypothetical protein